MSVTGNARVHGGSGEGKGPAVERGGGKGAVAPTVSGTQLPVRLGADREGDRMRTGGARPR